MTIECTLTDCPFGKSGNRKVLHLTTTHYRTAEGKIDGDVIRIDPLPKTFNLCPVCDETINLKDIHISEPKRQKDEKN